MSPSQMRLFGEPPPRRGGVGPAPAAHEMRAVAAALPSGVRLGTSSWSFPGWTGIVYDREATAGILARTGLPAYAKHPLLRAVGIDRTFYAPLPAAAMAAYAAQVDDDFRFVVKAPSACTSPWRQAGGKAVGRNVLYLDAGYARDESVAPFVEGLGPKGGALVFQFPPQGDEICREPAAFADRLAGFLSALPRGPNYSVEIRDRTLFCGGYLDALRTSEATHCLSVHPRMPSAEEQWAASAVLPRRQTVVRWMLGGRLGYEEAKSRYAPFARLVDEDPETRDALARAGVDEALAGHSVLIIVNNKAEGSAPLSVFRLAERIAARAARRET